jgi:uncharacterized coiled-coil DUF342 family protein
MTQTVLIGELAAARAQLREADRRILELAQDNERLRQELRAARAGDDELRDRLDRLDQVIVPALEATV